MTVLEIKNNFHNLIDSIDDNELLLNFYEIMNLKSKSENKALWNSLTETEQNEILISDEESNNTDNLISNKNVKKKYL